jgi:zinc transport system ATP-binding protein
MVQISAENLSIGYDKNIVIRDISFKVEKGDYLCVIGENGAGKSTLFKTLLKLQKPISGVIEYCSDLNEIGYLPQQRDIQKDFPATVIEVVLSGCLKKSGLRPFYNKSEKALAHENIERMGISNLSKQCFRELSGGQQQRVLLARALCATDKIVFLDEPAAGLDLDSQNQMYALIEKLNKDGVTIVMISHDIDAALKYASHILKIDRKANFFGTKSEYVKRGAK